MDKQRGLFEKAYGELVIGAPFDLDDTGTTYIDVDTETAWEVWQAALAQPAGEPIGDCATCEGEFPDSCSECSYSDEDNHPAPAQTSKVPEGWKMISLKEMQALKKDLLELPELCDDHRIHIEGVVGSAADLIDHLTQLLPKHLKPENFHIYYQGLARGLEANEECLVQKHQALLHAEKRIEELESLMKEAGWGGLD